MVENTSDDDWNNVDMVLVSGRPISYKMKLYEPLYIPRPEVELELFASLRPPLYSGSMDGKEAVDKMAGVGAGPPPPPPNQAGPQNAQQPGFQFRNPTYGPGNIGGMMGMMGMAAASTGSPA